MNKAIKNHDGLCWKCLQNFHPDDIIQIEIPAIGYGSQFDTFSTKVQLCKDCIAKTNEMWWKLNIIKGFSGSIQIWTEYEYEKEILEFIETLPVCSKELFYNSCQKWRHLFYYFDPQDWIDHELRGDRL